MHLWPDVVPDRPAARLPSRRPIRAAESPGCWSFRDWTLERWLGADRRRYIDELRSDIEALRKALPEKYAYVHGVHDVEKPVAQKLHLRGNPMREGDEVPRRFLRCSAPAIRGR